MLRQAVWANRWVGFAGLVLCFAANWGRAQQSGMDASPYTSGGRFAVGPSLPSGTYFPGAGYSTVNRGYTINYVPSYYSSPYTRFPSYYSNPPPYVPGVSPSYYVAPDYPGIYMTTINYPSIYGAYSQGITPSFFSYKSAPEFTTVRYMPGMMNTVISNTVTPPALGPSTTTLTTSPGQAATIDVTVPTEAQLWFDTTLTTQTGTTRQFITPPLLWGRDYIYNLRATWMESGQEMTRQRTIHVRPGERVTVSLLPEATQTELRGGTRLDLRPPNR
jgi:uncharacterized protein (TIGR03000 family)